MSAARLLLLCALVLLRPAAVVAQSVVVRVTDEMAGVPLVNAEVIDLDTEARRFSDAAGEVRMAWPAEGRLRLRVRQLGFRPAERTLVREDLGVAPVTIALARVAYALPDVFTRAENRCDTGGDAAARVLSATVVEQLRMAAERYEVFERSFPFRAKQERTTIRFDSAGVARRGFREEESADSDEWGERYVPRRVLFNRGRGFSLPIFFITSLGDPVFWEHHCFIVRGMESYRGERVFRLEFVPTPAMTDPDWAGVALIDSASSALRRVEFQLVNLVDEHVPRRFEGYTTFAMPSPYVVVPDSTVAIWWRDKAAGADGWGSPSAMQVVHVKKLEYRRRKPPAITPASAPPVAPPKGGGRGQRPAPGGGRLRD